MSAMKTALRGLTVAAATVGLTLGGASAANAAVVQPDTIGNTVVAHVHDPLPGQTCIGLAVPPYAALDVVPPAIGGDLMDILGAVANRDDIHALHLDMWPLNPPMTLPGQPGTLIAENVPSNFYALTVICMGGGNTEPHIHPVVVGDPLSAAGGSVQGSLGGGGAAPAPTGNTGSAS